MVLRSEIQQDSRRKRRGQSGVRQSGSDYLFAPFHPNRRGCCGKRIGAFGNVTSAPTKHRCRHFMDSLELAYRRPGSLAECVADALLGKPSQRGSN